MNKQTFSLRVHARNRRSLELLATKSGKSASITAKACCVSALERAPTQDVLAEIPEPRAPGLTVVVTLYDDDLARLRVWREAVPSNVSDGHFLSGLCALGLTDSDGDVQDDGSLLDQATPSAGLLSEINTALGQAQRGHQSQLSEFIGRRIGDPAWHGVLAAEASTGVGKTRAALAASLERMRECPNEVAWVAVPTLAVMRQWDTELRLVSSAVHPAPRWRCIFGKSEFVSPSALRDAIAQGEFTPEGSQIAERWLARGGCSANAMPDESRYLISSLQSDLGPEAEVPAHIRLVAAEADEEANAAYEQQFRPEGVQYILLTHAMLATEIRRRLITAFNTYRQEHGSIASLRAHLLQQRRAEKDARRQDEVLATFDLGVAIAELIGDGADASRLPPPEHLLVDEAHLLEANVANALAHDISLHALVRHARQLVAELPRLPAGLATDLGSIYSDIQHAVAALGAESSGQTAMRVDELAFEPLLREFSDRLQTLLQHKGRPKSHHSLALSNLQRGERALRLVFPEKRAGHQAFFRSSPVRAHPQVICGRPDLGLEFGMLWTQIAQRAVLISATLTIDTSNGADTLRRNLHIPAGTFVVGTPITPAWLTKPVTLLTPAAGRRADGTWRFAPPYSSKRQAESAEYRAWIAEIANCILGAHQASAGGALVLTNSYQDLSSIAAMFVGLPVVEVRKGLRLDEAVGRFCAQSAAGRRPLLIGTGALWTGVDIGGHRMTDYGLPPIPAAEDNVLTDLFVVRAPFGLSGSISHLNRVRVFGFPVEASAAAMMLKQGLGRLIRRDGLPENRRIHFLDGRLNDPISDISFRVIRSTLSPYNKRASF